MAMGKGFLSQDPGQVPEATAAQECGLSQPAPYFGSRGLSAVPCAVADADGIEVMPRASMGWSLGGPKRFGSDWPSPG